MKIPFHKAAMAILFLTALILFPGIEVRADRNPRIPEGFSAIGPQDPITKLPTMIIHEETRYLMVLVSQSRFQMGSNDASAEPDEQPVHSVYLDDYWIGREPVSIYHIKSFYNWYQRDPGKHITEPATKISWNHAVRWAESNGMRLPTEAEWEKAALGINGDTESLRIQTIPMPHPILPITLATRNTGGHDQGYLKNVGDVGEWCGDWYDSAYYSTSSKRNPIGPEDGTLKVWRGSSFGYVRVAERHSNPPDMKYRHIGFRTAVSPLPMSRKK